MSHPLDGAGSTRKIFRQVILRHHVKLSS